MTFSFFSANKLVYAKEKQQQDAEPDPKLYHTTVRKDLPTFQLKEVNKHSTKYDTIA